MDKLYKTLHREIYLSYNLHINILDRLQMWLKI